MARNTIPGPADKLGLQQDLSLSVLAVQLVSAAVPCGVAHRASERKEGSGPCPEPLSCSC